MIVPIAFRMIFKNSRKINPLCNKSIDSSANVEYVVIAPRSPVERSDFTCSGISELKQKSANNPPIIKLPSRLTPSVPRGRGCGK